MILDSAELEMLDLYLILYLQVSVKGKVMRKVARFERNS